MKSLRLAGIDYSQENVHYFVTLRFTERIDDETRGPLFRILLELFDETDYNCDALVVMPDHLHFVAHKGGESADGLSDLVCRLKSKGLHRLKEGERVARSFWQKGYHEHVVRNKQDFDEKVRYLMRNPLRAGLVKDWADYAFLYVGGLNDGVTQGHPLRDWRTGDGTSAPGDDATQAASRAVTICDDSTESG